MDLTGLFDTHAHLDAEDDAAAILAAANAAGVTRVLFAATTLADATRYQALAAAAPGVCAAVGVHPHQAAEFDGALEPFAALAAAPGVVAIGEIGLDYHYDFSPREVQRRVFRIFLELAVARDLPAILHCREAFDDCLAAVAEFAPAGLRCVLHSFTGTPAQAERFLALGACLGFSGMLTFTKADNIRAALAAVPMDRVLAETDSPWLAPVPHRGRRNQPAYVVEVVRRMAIERGITPEAAAAATTANALRVFRLAAGRA